MAVEFGIVTSVVPPTGWHYPQILSSGQTIRLQGFTFEQLLENMLDFRRRHHVLCGGHHTANVEAVRDDLRRYLCEHYIQNCADPGKAAGAFKGRVGIGVTNYRRPIDRGADWLARIANERLEKVDPALAASRAQICAQCPQNVRWATPCGPCNDNVSVRIQQAKGSLHTPYDRSLFHCRIYGHINEVAVWLIDTRSESEQTPPANCWKAQ